MPTSECGVCSIPPGMSLSVPPLSIPPQGFARATPQEPPLWGFIWDVPNPASPASRWYTTSSPLANDTNTWLSRYLWGQTTFDIQLRAPLSHPKS